MSCLKTNHSSCNCKRYNPDSFCQLRVCHTSNLEQECHHSLLWLRVRSESCTQRIHVECCCLTNTLWIAECCKTCLSMVSSWAAHTNSSEWQVAVQDLDNWIIYNESSWACSLLHLFYVLFALAEKVNCQRLWSFLDFVNYIVNVMVRNDG